MAMLFLFVTCAVLYANAVPLFEDGPVNQALKLPSKAIGKVQDGFEQLGVGPLTQRPMEIVQIHADMPRQIVTSPFRFAKKFLGRLVDTPHRLYTLVHDSVVDTRDKVESLVSSSHDKVYALNDKIATKLDLETPGVAAASEEAISQIGTPIQPAEFGSEELEILSVFGEMEKMTNEMNRRGQVMKDAINKYYNDQQSSLLLTKKEKSDMAAEQAAFNKFHDEKISGMVDAKSLAEILEMRAAYLEKYLPKYEEIIAKNCAAEYNEEETQIVKEFPSPELLAIEMRRRAGVMIDAISKYYIGIQQSSSASEEQKQEAAEKLLATKAYHEDQLKKMGETDDMKTTMCYRWDYLVQLMPRFETIISKK